VRKKTKNDASTSVVNAITAMAKSMSGVFGKYSRQTRTKAWKRLSSAKGDKEMAKLALNPKRPLSNFRKLQFKEWLNSQDG